jgi:hypothetical protein
MARYIRVKPDTIVSESLKITPAHQLHGRGEVIIAIRSTNIERIKQVGSTN